MTTLLIPSSARISGLSEACTSLEKDVGLLNHNPAGVNGLTGWNTLLMYQRGYADDNYSNIHVSKDYRDLVLASSIIYYTTGKIDLYTSQGERRTEVGKQDIIWTLGASKKIWRIPAGLNLKIISSSLFGEKATAYAFDIGTQYRVSNPINLGLCAKNIGTHIKYIDEREDLPKVMQIGGSYTRQFSNYNLLLLDDIAYYINEKNYLYMLGAELGYKDQLFLRTGYQINLTETANKSVSLGVGFNYKKYTISYSLEFRNDLDIPHRLSMGYNF